MQTTLLRSSVARACSIAVLFFSIALSPLAASAANADHTRPVGKAKVAGSPCKRVPQTASKNAKASPKRAKSAKANKALKVQRPTKRAGVPAPAAQNKSRKVAAVSPTKPREERAPERVLVVELEPAPDAPKKN